MDSSLEALDPKSAPSAESKKAPPSMTPESHGESAAKSSPESHSTHDTHPPKRPKGNLCGPLSKNLAWNARQGPLLLAGTVTIGPGVSLTIGAGTEIRIGSYDSCPDSGAVAGGHSIALVVRGGTLLIAGLPDKPIVFKPLAEARGFLWEGIRIEKSSRDQDATLRWFELSRASKGVSFLAGAGRIDHGVIEDCGIGIASLLGASPTVTHSVLSRSVVADVVSSRSATRILSCLFLDGRGDAIRFDGVGLSEIATSCFWGHRGSVVVRGPAGLGGWKSDSVPDPFGNWRRDPVLRESNQHQILLAQSRKSLAGQPWWKSRRPPEDPPGTGRWALSPFSPMIDRGETRFCSDSDGSKCDIGLWGGK